ncbi:MAG: helix-turn-helix transcriptional regulator [Bacteroidia bacterium]|nr:helix-turn-helix transcriptional regulator [Bacteroidia bacterium]
MQGNMNNGSIVFPTGNKPISERELEVLRLLLQEKTTLEIAESLQISHHTVETYRKNLLKKTNTRSIVGLVTFALRNKIS